MWLLKEGVTAGGGLGGGKREQKELKDKIALSLQGKRWAILIDNIVLNN